MGSFEIVNYILLTGALAVLLLLLAVIYLELRRIREALFDGKTAKYAPDKDINQGIVSIIPTNPINKEKEVKQGGY